MGTHRWGRGRVRVGRASATWHGAGQPVTSVLTLLHAARKEKGRLGSTGGQSRPVLAGPLRFGWAARVWVKGRGCRAGLGFQPGFGQVPDRN
jgi:hypothetical protein